MDNQVIGTGVTDRLERGVARFRERVYRGNRRFFEELEGGQRPHTLFITCSDSRVDPTLLTDSRPGELFIVRNIANIVPPYRRTEEYVSTTAAIEYALLALKVSFIVVCGHTNCGGCAALLGDPAALPRCRIPSDGWSWSGKRDSRGTGWKPRRWSGRTWSARRHGFGPTRR
jgi:carbonic anhydrase